MGYLEVSPGSYALFDVSGARVYWRVPLASTSTLLGRVVRHSKDVLSRLVEPGASTQPAFDGLGLLFAKETQWVCG